MYINVSPQMSADTPKSSSVAMSEPFLMFQITKQHPINDYTISLHLQKRCVIYSNQLTAVLSLMSTPGRARRCSTSTRSPSLAAMNRGGGD